MGLEYKLKKAGKIVSSLNPGNLEEVRGICLEIRLAQENLLHAGEDILNYCQAVCQGLCCRRVELDMIISHWDFVFLMILHKSWEDRIADCLERCLTFFPSNCVFLENGVGPCIFPHDSKPEVCIVTFCGDASTVKKEIKEVKSKFLKLSRFITFKKPRYLL